MLEKFIALICLIVCTMVCHYLAMIYGWGLSPVSNMHIIVFGMLIPGVMNALANHIAKDTDE